LLPELEKLSKIGAMIEKWNKHITSGKGLLHKAAGSIMGSGVLFALGLAVFADEDPTYYQSAGAAIFIGLFAAGYAYAFMRGYLSLKREIAEKSDNLRVGRPIIKEDEL